MSWWQKIYENINSGDNFETPGEGIERIARGIFEVIGKNIDKIIIRSGKSMIPLEESCFEVIEEFFNESPHGRLRIAAVHGNEPFMDSADKLIRERSGSQLARANYVCSILENELLVCYVMQGNRKYIELNARI